VKKVVHIVFLALLFLLVSCESTQYFSVETTIPGEIIFPILSPRVVVVNNAVAQPADNGVEHFLGSKQLENHPLSKDSVYKAFIHSLADILSESTFFDEVLIYNEPTREDRVFLLPRRIDIEKAAKITKDVDADALLLVDRLLFKYSQRLVGNDSYFSSTRLICDGEFSVYFADEEEIVHTFSLSDTVKFNNYVGSDTTLFFEKIPQQLLKISAERMAEKVADKYAPHLRYSERLLYVSFNSQMKTAHAFFKKGNIEEAIDVWTKIYLKPGNNIQRGKAAINIATIEEMNSSYTAALAWVDKALEAYSLEKPQKAKEEKKYANYYKNELEALRQSLLLLR